MVPDRTTMKPQISEIILPAPCPSQSCNHVKYLSLINCPSLESVKNKKRYLKNMEKERKGRKRRAVVCKSTHFFTSQLNFWLVIFHHFSFFWLLLEVLEVSKWFSSNQIEIICDNSFTTSKTTSCCEIQDISHNRKKYIHMSKWC